MKTVFSNAELPHIWAHLPADQYTGRNSNGSISFNKNEYKSYNTVIARRIGSTVLMSSCTYSVTTSNHQSSLKNAFGYNVTYCTDVNDHPETNYKSLVRNVMLAIEKQKTARTKNYIAEANEKIAEFKIYANLMQYKMPADTIESISNQIAVDKIKLEKIKKQAIAKRKKAGLEFKKSINWHNVFRAYDVSRRAFHAGHNHFYSKIKRALSQFKDDCQYYSITAPGNLPAMYPDFLRTTASGIITTQGVNISLSNAKAVNALYKSGISLVGKKIGIYEVQEYTQDYIKVGCHLFARSEFERISQEIS